MSTSIMIHDVTSVSTDGSVHYSNSNAVTLRIEAGGYSGTTAFDITVFSLSTEAAEHLSRRLSRRPDHRFDEAAIRADERAKVTARLAALIGEAA
jgi:hypothetical protein